MTDIQFNPKTKQITYQTPDGGQVTLDRHQYKVSEVTGQLAIPTLDGRWEILDGPVEQEKLPVVRAPRTPKWFSSVTGKEVTPLPSTRESFGEGAEQGLTLGFKDELTGASEAARKAVGLGKQGYTEARDAARNYRDVVQSRHPWAYLTGEFAGAAPAAVATGGESLAGQLVAGASLGTISGAGHSDADTAAGMASDALKGGAIGTGLAGAGAAAPALVRTITPTGRALKALTPLAEEVQGAQQQPGRPAEHSLRLADALRGASHASPIKASGYIPAARAALAEGYDRTIQGLSDMVSPENAVKMIAEANRVAKTNAKELYPEAYSLPDQIELPLSLLSNPYFKFALPEARRLAKAEGRNLDVTKLTTEDVHNIRQSLDDAIKSAFKAGKSNVGYATKEVRNALTAEAYKVNPKLQVADLDYSKNKAIVDAVQKGVEASKPGKDITEVQMEFDGLSFPEQQAYKVGLASGFKQRAGTTAAKRTPEKLLEVPNVAAKLEAVGVPSELIEDFVKVAEGKAAFADAVIGGSATGKNIAFKEGIRHPLEDITGGTVAGTALTSGAGAAVPLVQGAGRGLSRRTADLLIDALASETPALLRRLKYRPGAAPGVRTASRAAAQVLPPYASPAIDMDTLTQALINKYFE